MNARAGTDGEQLGLFGGTADDAEAAPPPVAASRPGEDDALAADQDARTLAQREFRRPLLVEAGAGTGKTTTLTARLLAWSLGPGWERAEERVRDREAERHPLAAPSSRLLEPDAEAVAAEALSRVVAITFTEAAAAEMAKRAGETLSRLARSESRPEWLDPDALPPEPECARRARALLGALDRLVVRTIHAFCRSLLAAHPLEAGLHPSLEVDADGAAVEELARETVEARLVAGYGEPGDPDLLALAARGVGPADLVTAAVVLVQEGVRAADLETSPFSDEGVRELRDGLARAARTLQEAIGDRLDGATRSGKSLEALASLAETIELCAEAGEDVGGFATLCGELANAWSETRERLRDWSRGKLNKTEAEALGEAAGAVAEAAAALLLRVDHLRTLDPELLEHGRRALAPVVAQVRRQMRRRGVATFQDLLSEARDLLAHRADVAARSRRRIDQLLVDELQDTDRLQCDVVAALGLEGPEDERPGLFLVGDPKQSIYGWRNADLRAYEDLWRRVEAAGGLRLTLSQNFRSVPAILAEVAATVRPVMVERSGLQPRFEPLVACPRLAGEPGFVRGPWAAVEHWVSWRAEDGAGAALADTRSGDATAVEAEAVARDLVRLHREEGLPWGAAALLLRAFTDLEDYLDAFRRHGVPFAVTGDRQYYRRREVIDAAALVRAVLDPGDHLALLTLLRSPAVGVPDAALVPLWSEGLPRWITELDPSDARGLATDLAEIRDAVARAAARLPDPAQVPGLERLRGWEAILVATVESLAHLRRAFATEPADRFVADLRRRVPLEAVASARYLGRYRLANLERFFRRLTEAMERDAGDVEAILRALRRGVAQALEEEEGRLAGGGEEDAVQVMTIHKAKGLDFAHVYVPQMHKGSPPDALPRIGVGRSVDGAGEGSRVEYCLFGAPTPGFAAVADEARRVEAAERVRTLYVAMTRAEKRLVLVGAWPEAPVPRPPEEARSYLDLLAERFSGVESVAALWEEAKGSAGRVDRHGARWVFPALEAPEAESKAAEPAVPGAALPGPEAVAADAARLRDLREAARERQGRKLSAPASKQAHDRLEALAETRYEEGVSDIESETGDGGPEREVAMAVGSAIHRVLEEMDLTAEAPEPAEELARLRERLPELLAPYLADPDQAARAEERCETLLDRLEPGGVAERLAALRGHVVARELPVLLGADPDAPDGPVSFVSGALDLLYRDPDSGDLVVADFKTDRAESEEEVAALAQAYTPQARLYASAVQQALDLPHPPRAELWFLWPGKVAVVPASHDRELRDLPPGS